MRVVQETNYFSITLSFLFGIVLTILPLPEWAIWLRPQWMFAILLFWVITSPSQCGIILAWMVGLVTDLMTGTPLGQHAIVFVILTYFILKIHASIVHFPSFQQAGVIAFFAVFNAILQGMVLGITGQATNVSLYALSAVTTAIIWPLLVKLLDKMRPKAYLH
jgi:rod shape-determining protein MreD